MADNLLDTNQEDPIQIDPSKNYVEELVGDGKKFKTVEDLARGKVESDVYIKTLEQRSDELRADYLRLREEYNAGPKLQEVLDQLKQTRQQPSLEQEPSKLQDNNPVIDSNQIESLVAAKVQEIEVRRKQDTNYNQVKEKLKERFGNNYANVLKDKAQSLGLTDDLVNNLARTSPDAFFNTLGLNEQRAENFQTPPRSDRRNDNFSPSVKKKDWSYYQEMKKKDAKLYYNPKIAVEMHDQVIALGEDAFYGNSR